ncbi:MAG TPA: alpha/beta fold hydrolase, partial [Steroidobacteraceae bacterium]|nr:alpha/beta fold hydrolase [Steroidobacteraceae bacterium]
GVKPASLARLAAAVRADPAAGVRSFLRRLVRGLAPRTAARTFALLEAALAADGAPSPQALEWGLARLAEADLRPALAMVKKPTLVLAGELDRITPSAASRALAGALPKASFRQLRGAGHVPFLSHRGQFVKLLREFLRA